MRSWDICPGTPGNDERNAQSLQESVFLLSNASDLASIVAQFDPFLIPPTKV